MAVSTTSTAPTQLELPWSGQDQVLFSRAAETHRAARGADAKQRHRQTKPRESTTLDTATASRQPSHTVLTYPTVIVSAPRVAAAHYGDQPWAEVLRAAARGVDGLAVLWTLPRPWLGRPCDATPDPQDVAFLAEGQDEWRGRTVLYQQNW